MVLRQMNWKDYSASLLAKHFNIIMEIRDEGDNEIEIYDSE